MVRRLPAVAASAVVDAVHIRGGDLAAFAFETCCPPCR